MNEDFKWTDELVKEFLKFFSEEIDRYMGDYGETILAILNSFKQSKLNSSNKDWEIVSLKGDYGGHSDVLFEYISHTGFYVPEYHCFTYGFANWTLGDVIKNHNGKIHSVRRLSDGEVFSVGDIIEFGVCEIKNAPIERFEINYFDKNEIEAYHKYAGRRFKGWKKTKQPLFTTDEVPFVQIFENDVYWIVGLPSFNLSKSIGIAGAIRRPNQLYFSTEQSAKDWIVSNKPVLSLNDIEIILFQECDGTYANDKEEWRFVYDYRPIELLKSLKERAEQKISNGNNR